MELPFTHKPGRRERQLLRRHENPLFAWPPQEVLPEDLLAAQRADHEELEAFRESFRTLVQRAVDLPPDAGSEPVLELKTSLERHYEQSCGLPEDHAHERAALRQLIDLIMRAIRKAAGSDPLARQELADEEDARTIHFRLLEHPLVADLLHPQSPILPTELVPTLLSAPLAEVEAVLDLFDREQIAQLTEESARLLDALAARGVDVTQPGQRISLLLVRSGPATTRRH
jgi:hypothetical protein